MTQPEALQTPVYRTATGRVYNFSAGPAVLPEPVLLEVKEELPVYRNLGTSILEISHRSPEYAEIDASPSPSSLRSNVLAEASISAYSGVRWLISRMEVPRLR